MKHFYKTISYACILMLSFMSVPAHSVDYNDYPELREMVAEMVAEDGYPRDDLVAVLAAASIDDGVIRSMDRQYEALPWHQYRRRFVTDERIGDGVKWWDLHAETLDLATRKFGVPAAVMVALIGVETNFGRRLGGKRVLDSLVTLTAAYPRRSAFFRRELRAFLNTTRSEKIPAESVRGSFAGAVGIPQFMPTSYEAYAVDLNENGRRDLVGEVADAIGSVGNYLAKRGWRRGQAIFADLPDGIPEAGGIVGE